ncbi:MAG: endonuclease/exonuclease/phosphatase family protein [Candidatus Eremiobacteraeota bacterium]|nr:endonuclease/exonuclease/phosphatase family protein [Candidatus Eremiobacteraeota bacterium]MCW5871095.1 endonuclease/exonuclease/phosphatase family protein [Candidatus Eremiobacteraeota bacterium]
MLLRIITQNLWFDSHRREARMQAHAAHWQQLQPDIIAIQEATLACLRPLLPLISNFHSTVTLESSAQWQGIAVLSRQKPDQVDMLPLPGEMGRRLLRVRWENLELGVVHLESTASAGPTRAAQLSQVFSQLQGPDTLLVGDFNFCSTSPENARLPAAFVDLWPALHPGTPGWTLDSQTNPLLRGSKQARYDRMLLKSKNWRCRSIALSQSNSSDHFGLVAELEK